MKETIKAILSKDRYNTDDLRTIIGVLRSEQGCPWDREQTHKSIRREFIEETYEVIEAIDTDDNTLLCEELGDVMLQVVFHATIAEEEGAFFFDDVTDGICKKMIERHPHVFGEVQVSGVGDVLTNWEAIKQRTKHRDTLEETMESVSKALPSLLRAEKLIGKAEKGGGVAVSTVDDRIAELEGIVAEMKARAACDDGDGLGQAVAELLFATSGLCRAMKADPERLLYDRCDAYIRAVCQKKKS